MRKLWIVLAFFTLASYAQDRTQWDYKDYWRETKLSFEQVIYGNINNSTCYSSLNFYMGCLEAINSAYAYLHWERGVVYLATPNFSAYTNKEIPGFTFLKLSASDPQYQIKLDAYLARAHKAYATAAENLVAKRADFTFAMHSFELKAPEKDRSYACALVYNKFLQVAYDPHTYILPVNYREDDSKLTHEAPRKLFGFSYSEVIYKGKKRYAITELENGPMAKAGVQLGDVILKANDATSQKSIDLEFDKDAVMIELIGSDGPKSLYVERGSVSYSSIDSKLLDSSRGTKIGYISFDSFSVKGICNQVEAKAKELIALGAEAFIMDIRDNGGGLVVEAKCIMSLFLEDYSIVFSTKDLKTGVITKSTINRYRDTAKFYKPNILGDFHVVTLVNGYSASASEATATYLKAYRKSYILGERTYGKGTMQGNAKLANNSLVNMASTSAIYLGPHGISPQLQGVEPDFVVLPTFGQTKPTYYVREKDSYSTAIPYAPTPMPEMYTRKEEVANIKNCMQTNDYVNKDFKNSDVFQQYVFDQQIIAAEAVLDCALNMKLQVYDTIYFATK